MGIKTGELELWGGIECTVNRVGEQFFNQYQRSGHCQRIEDDIAAIADLGIRKLRYGVLWETVYATGKPDWRDADSAMEAMARYGMEPIVGLVHHGSGPAHTSLVDPCFAEGVSEFASEVSERYAHVRDWTPVNEPLTTARFSGLYGHWYPHERSELGFVTALFTELRGTVLAMRAIRSHVPGARLVQTEDMGRVAARPKLQYQADFENERRWLSFDLLLGRVTPSHPMYGYLLWAGALPEEIAWFVQNPCPPDLLGINHYVTSERFLDDRVDRYRDRILGSNGRHTYVDVEAVRVPEGPLGAKEVFREVWDRYGLPMAITEAHLGCTREEQMRWLQYIWDSASDLRQEGARFEAVTAWAMLGSHDWSTLLTRDDGVYEPGLFDVSAGYRRPTALASVARWLASGERRTHPVMQVPGWWERPVRQLYPKADRESFAVKEPGSSPLLITGATGTLGRAFARACDLRGIPYKLTARQELDAADESSVRATLDAWQPWAVVNTAGFVRVDDAEVEIDRCHRENVIAPATLAQACAERGLPFVTFSSDLVFGGEAGQPHVESSAVQPLNVYGESKAEAERQVLKIHPGALVVRTSAFFGPWDEHNFALACLRTLAAGEAFEALQDQVISPTYVPDLMHASLDLLLDQLTGIVHVANQGAMNWVEFGRLVARRAGLDEELVEGVSSTGLPARRPTFSALSSERIGFMPGVDEAVERFLLEVEFAWKPMTTRRGYLA